MKPRPKEKYLIDEKGHTQAVVIDIERYREMVEDIADLRVVADRKDNQKLSAANFTLRLKKHGIL